MTVAMIAKSHVIRVGLKLYPLLNKFVIDIPIIIINKATIEGAITGPIHG